MNRNLRRVLEVVGVGLLLYLAVSFVVVLIDVNGSSMSTTLEDGSLVFGVRPLPPHRGDVVVFRPSGDPSSADFIKRVIAVPGDQLQVKDAVIKVNGTVVLEDYLPEIWRTGTTWRDGQLVTMGADEYFLMGDNRNHSNDSRVLGPQSRRFIEAVAVLRVWPVTRVGPVLRDPAN